MSRFLLATTLLVAIIIGSVSAVSLEEFDSTVEDFGVFTEFLELQESHEDATNEYLGDEELAFLEMQEDEGGANPSYTLPYPAVTYASHVAGGFVHPFSNVNPLAAPWAGFAPVAAPTVATAAAIAASPLSAYYANAIHPALGVNAAIPLGDVKGGYNVHGLNPSFGGYHPNLGNDLTSLSGKAAAGGEEAGFIETEMETSSQAEMESQLQAEAEAEAELDADIAALSELDSESDSESESEVEMTTADFANIESLDSLMLEVGDDEEGGEEAAGGGGGEAGANPSYTLPYPPVLPGHYTPLFNPYTNVNPLSTPFSNYAAQPGAHPGVASAAAAQAGALAAVNGQVAGVAGGYPYYPFAARNPVIAAQLQGNPVPFSGYAGWIHPQNLNSASVGTNEEAASLGQFIEVSTEQMDHGECVGCEY